MPKALRPFFCHDRRLLAEVSRVIYDILREFYHEVAGRALLTGTVLAHQTFGDMLRCNPHFHAGCMAEQQCEALRPGQHIPSKRLQLIRRYGLYASRTKGWWHEMPWVAERAPEGWKATRQHPADGEHADYEPLSDEDEEVGVNARKRAWARLLAKVYEVDPLVCPNCGAAMKVIAVIEDPNELGRILRHLVKIGRSPPGIRSRSAQLTAFSPRLIGRDVSVSRHKRSRSSPELSYPCAHALK